jgi:hypothetical protein
MARKAKISPEVQADFCKALEVGGTYQMAAAKAGIGEATAYRYLKRGEEEESGPYREFWLAARESTKKCGLAWLAKIQTLGNQKGDWKAYAWLLERRFPADFARLSDRPAAEMETVDEAESMAVQLLEALRASRGEG